LKNLLTWLLIASGDGNSFLSTITEDFDDIAPDYLIESIRADSVPNY